MPPRFTTAIYEIFALGATLLLTSAPLLERTTARARLNIMNADRPGAD